MMLSFKHFLLEYDVDQFVRGMSPSELGYSEKMATKYAPVRPSISRSVVRANSKMLSVLRRLHQEGKLTQIGYHPSTDLPVPSKMTQGDLELLRSHAAKHLKGSEESEFNLAAHILVVTDPRANIELQNMGGVRGTNPQGRGSEESRRGGAGENLMIARSQQRRQTP